jgi:hypothetical protein
MSRFSLVVFALALPALVAGCASTPPTASPSAAPRVLVVPDTNAPRIENSDAAGVISVPGYHSVTPEATVVTPPPAAVTPAPVIVVPPR